MPRQLSLFLVATQFLTRLPVPQTSAFDALQLKSSARYFPLVGTLVGALAVAVWWLASRVLPPTIAVGLMLAATLLVTGAFHEDGFADACDGFGGGTAPERVLAIMKDSRIGAYGAIGIAMMLALKWSTLVALPPRSIPLLVVAAHTVSRWCAIGLIWRLPYARADTDSKSGPFASGLSGLEWMLSGLIGAFALVLLMLLTDTMPASPAGRALLGAVLAAILMGGIAAVYFRRRIGGYTGDCLGATQQLCELAFLLTALAILDAERAG